MKKNINKINQFEKVDIEMNLFGWTFGIEL